MNLQKTLNQKGHRLTQPRRIVVSILQDAKVPLSPQTIHERSRATQAEIGLTSVYRTLDLLSELMLVRRVHGPDGCQGYVLASPGHHHHLVCRMCNRAIEFTGESEINSLIEHIEKKTAFKIDGHMLQLLGICPDCQQKQKNLKGQTSEKKALH